MTIGGLSEMFWARALVGADMFCWMLNLIDGGGVYREALGVDIS